MIQIDAAVQFRSKLEFLKEDPDFFFFLLFCCCFLLLYIILVFMAWFCLYLDTLVLVLTKTLWSTLFACVFRRCI